MFSFKYSTRERLPNRIAAPFASYSSKLVIQTLKRREKGFVNMASMMQLYFLKTNLYLNKKCRYVFISRTSFSVAIRDF